jgi:serine protease Do
MIRLRKNVGLVWKTVLLVVCLALVVGMPTPGFAQSMSPRQIAQALSQAFAETARDTMPAVVSITIEKVVTTKPGAGDANDSGGSSPEDFLRRFFGGELPQMRSPHKYLERGQGSGFIISSDGYILTNNHVAGNVDKMKVVLQDGRTFTDAKVIGTDPDSEVALIKIEGNDFPVLPMGDSDRLQIGDMVMAIGNPFGLMETVTVGVVSATKRSVGITAYESFIQTDAAINPGNSGGPLVNMDGRAIGINTAIVSESGGYMGIGFAIPINMARRIAEQLRRSGRVVRGYLGLYGQDVTPEIAPLLKLPQPQGVLVAQVEPRSPAAEAGIQRGDVIVAMDGKNIDSYTTFRNQIAALQPGTRVALTIIREGQTLERPVVLGERPSGVAQAAPPQTPTPEEPRQTLGVEVQNLSPGLAQRFGYQVGQGVLVTAVAPESPADAAGIEAGDLIVSVNRQAVTSVDEFARAIRQARGAGKALLLVQRRNASQFVVVTFR